MDELFRNYVLSADCLADPEHLDIKELGNFRRNVSSVKALVEGSFTRAGRNETLVTFFMGHCGVLGSHYERWGSNVIVIMEAGKVVTVTDAGPTNAIELLPVDLENDGADELLAISADYAAGETFSEAEIWSISSGMTQLAHFEFSRRSCLVDEQEYFESTLFTRRDPQTNRLCFLQQRRELQCPPRPVDP